jgi:hypothetical protein
VDDVGLRLDHAAPRRRVGPDAQLDLLLGRRCRLQHQFRWWICQHGIDRGHGRKDLAPDRFP